MVRIVYIKFNGMEGKGEVKQKAKEKQNSYTTRFQITLRKN